jgi:uncharacterized protein (TIGR02246 family)
VAAVTLWCIHEAVSECKVSERKVDVAGCRHPRARFTCSVHLIRLTFTGSDLKFWQLKSRRRKSLRNFYLALTCCAALILAIPATAQTKAAPAPGVTDKEKIETLYQAYVKAFKAKDVNAIMTFYEPNELFVFDVMPPREYASWAAYKKDWEGLFTSNPGRADVHLTNLEITVVGLVAYAHNMQTAYFTGADGSRLDVSVRVTDVLRKANGKWLIVQEHVSVPVDLATGKADLASKP